MTKSAIRTLLNGIKALIPPAQVQADYKNNNSNTPSYVKNRPFYRDGGELKQLEEEFVPPISAGNVYFDQDLSDKYLGAKNTKEGFSKIIDDVYETKEISNQTNNDNQSVRIIGNNEEIFIGISNFDGVHKLCKSVNGINWEPISVNDFNFAHHECEARYLKGFWFVHDMSKAYYSKDLKNWVFIDFAEEYSIYGTFYEARGKIYACISLTGATPVIMVSDDGAFWKDYGIISLDDEYFLDYWFSFACNDYGFALNNDNKVYYTSFEEFGIWKEYSLSGYGGSKIRSINNVFYKCNSYGLTYAKYTTPNELIWNYYYAGEYCYVNRGLAAFKEGYYVFYFNLDWNSDYFLYTKDFITFERKEANGEDSLFATKKALVVGSKIYIGPKNALGFAKEKQLVELSDQINNNQALIKKAEDIIGQDYVILRDGANGFNYVLQMQNGNLISHCRYVSLEVAQLPNKSTYELFEEFEPEGMIVIGISEDGTSSEVMIYDYEKTIPLTNSSTYNLPITVKQGKEELKCYVTLNVNNPYIDFVCRVSDDGMILTGWRETYQGESSTKCILPDVEGTIL